MKIAISIPDELFESGEKLAKKLGVSRSKLYAMALQEQVSFHDGEAITARLNEVYADKQETDLFLLEAGKKIFEESDW